MKVFSTKARFPIFVPTIGNLKPVVSHVEPSKGENWRGLLLSLSHSR